MHNFFSLARPLLQELHQNPFMTSNNFVNKQRQNIIIYLARVLGIMMVLITNDDDDDEDDFDADELVRASLALSWVHPAIADSRTI